MHRKIIGFLFLLSASAWLIPASAAITVTFVDADRFTDSGRYGMDTKGNLQEIEQHLKRLGEKYLQPDQRLKIEVLDIDLAGRDRYSSRAQTEIRVLRGGADWPSIKVRYALQTGQTSAPPREETVSDMNYLARTPRDASQRLPYEKRMLDEWFRERFGVQQSPQ